MDNKFEMAKKQLNPILRPCPFCGNDKAYIANYAPDYGYYVEPSFYVECICGIRTGKFTSPYRLFITECSMTTTSVILAANAWNRKPNDIGTFACPDCGVSIPHSHKSKDKYGTIIVELA